LFREVEHLREVDGTAARALRDLVAVHAPFAEPGEDEVDDELAHF